MRLPWVKRQRSPKKKGMPKLHLQRSLEANLKSVQEELDHPYDLVIRKFRRGGSQALPAAAAWINGLANEVAIDQQIQRPLMFEAWNAAGPGALADHALTLGGLQTTEDLRQVVAALLAGDTAILVHGAARAYLASTPGWPARPVEEPPSEVTLRGPRQGFVEDLRVNTTLLRRNLRTPDLRLENMTIGQRTRTPLVIAYLDGIANPRIVQEVKTRLVRIKIDGILSDNYLEELIRDAPYSPFPTISNTERPDVVAAGLLEGQVAILTDRYPFVLRAPTLFLQFFQTPEDDYLNYQIAALGRWLRLLGLTIALTLPSIYVAVTTFHPEMIPPQSLTTIDAAGEGVPFPMVVEALLMEFAFEALREAGLRMPRALGQAMSIVGALILGQAAIDAGYSPGCRGF
ncbi:MAG: spore germination protein [Clostridia bacterium]|nr:MAG: spore germination protein [Clostridia bacterium]